MAVNDIIAIVAKYAINPLLWLILIIVFLGGLIFILYMRKKRRLKYEVAEIVDLGSGKSCINTDLKAGFMGKKLYLRGLWWSGEEVLRTSAGDRIEYFSTEDFQEVNGKRGVICFRDPVRQNILIPINKLSVKNRDLIAAIAPADFTDVAVDIVKDATSETTDWKDKLIQFGAWALVVIFSLIAIIVIVQYVKSAQDKAADLLLNAGKDGIEACKNICKEAVNVAISKVAGGTAP